MADNYLEFSETLDSLNPEEEKWLNEQLADDPDAGCPVFLVDYDNRDPDDSDYGFCVSFEGQGETRHLWLYADEHGDVGRVAHLIQKFLKRFRPDQCWALGYATTCSKLRVGEFGGGAVFVTADDIHWQNTCDFIEEERAKFEAAKVPVEAAP
jgi:hypothetical protein